MRSISTREPTARCGPPLLLTMLALVASDNDVELSPVAHRELLFAFALAALVLPVAAEGGDAGVSADALAAARQEVSRVRIRRLAACSIRSPPRFTQASSASGRLFAAAGVRVASPVPVGARAGKLPGLNWQQLSEAHFAGGHGSDACVWLPLLLEMV